MGYERINLRFYIIEEYYYRIIKEYYCNSFSCRYLWNNEIVNLETGTFANLPTLAEL